MRERVNPYEIDQAWKSRVEVAREIEFPKVWDARLIKDYKEKAYEIIKDRKETPFYKLDLTSEGCGNILVKDESDTRCNPTGTIKDRMGYQFAIAQNYQFTSGSKSWNEEYMLGKPIRRFSILTAGNAGCALAYAMQQRGLPPVKLLMDSHTPKEILDRLKQYQADIYLVDLSVNPFSGRPSEQDPLTEEQILTITNNNIDYGTDITSIKAGEPYSIYYRSLVDNVFKKSPEEIYIPYGSGALYENFLWSQHLSLESPYELLDRQGKKEMDYLRKVKIFGSEPSAFPSIADKLAAKTKPFKAYPETEIRRLRQKGFTRLETGVYKVNEDEIKEAYELLKIRGEKFGLKTEPSAAAGLALYIKRGRAGLVPEGCKVIVINTGCGIVSEKAE